MRVSTQLTLYPLRFFCAHSLNSMSWKLSPQGYIVMVFETWGLPAVTRSSGFCAHEWSSGHQRRKSVMNKAFSGQLALQSPTIATHKRITARRSLQEDHCHTFKVLQQWLNKPLSFINYLTCGTQLLHLKIKPRQQYRHTHTHQVRQNIFILLKARVLKIGLI